MDKDKKFYIAAGIFFGLGFLAVTFIFGKDKKENRVTFGQVEQIRKETMVKSKIDRSKVEVQNYMNAPAISNQYHATKEIPVNDAGLKLESSVNHAAQDSRGSGHNAMPTNVLESQTDKLLANKQRYEQMNIAQKKQHIEDYKRQAKQMGYVLEVDGQLNIIRFERDPASAISQPKLPVDVDQMEEEYDESGEE